MNQSDKLHIVMLTEYFYPFDRGGSEWSTYYLAQGLIKKQGYMVSIFTPNYGSKRHETYKGVTIYRFSFWKKLKNSYETVSPFSHSNLWFWFMSSLYLLTYCSRSKIDILHVQGKYMLVAAVVVGKLFKIPVIVTLRDYIVLCPYSFCINVENHYQACDLRRLFTTDRLFFLKHYARKSDFSGKLYSIVGALHGYFVGKLLRWCLQQCQEVVAISHKVAEIYKLNGVAISRTIHNPMHFISTKTINKQNFFLYVGRLTPGKGITQLIDAYLKLSQQKKLPQLIVIGEGWLKSILDTKAKAIKFLGQLPHRETMDYIRKARFVIVPPVWEEPFGRVALEALASGTLVISSNRGGLPEFVTDGMTGVVTKPTVAGIARGISRALYFEQKLQANLLKQRSYLVRKFQHEPVDSYELLYKHLYAKKFS